MKQYYFELEELEEMTVHNNTLDVILLEKKFLHWDELDHNEITADLNHNICRIIRMEYIDKQSDLLHQDLFATMENDDDDTK